MFQGVRVPMPIFTVLLGLLCSVLGTLLIALATSHISMSNEISSLAGSYGARIDNIEKNQTIMLNILMDKYEGKNK